MKTTVSLTQTINQTIIDNYNNKKIKNIEKASTFYVIKTSLDEVEFVSIESGLFPNFSQP